MTNYVEGAHEKQPFSRGRPLTGSEVEELILEHLDLLESDNENHREAQVTAKRAEVAYRIEHARLLLVSTAKTEAQRAAYALYHARELLDVRATAEAYAAAWAETCRLHRSELEGLRSIIASARAAEYGA